MSFNSSKVESALLRKGFKRDKSHHNYYVLYDGDKKTSIYTYVSHCGQEINDYLISKMKKQVRLSKKDFEDLINCPLSKERYLEMMKEQGYVK